MLAWSAHWRVVNDQDGRASGTLLGGKCQQLLREHRRHVRMVSGDFAVQEPDDRVLPGICRVLAYAQRVEERQ